MGTAWRPLIVFAALLLALASALLVARPGWADPSFGLLSGSPSLTGGREPGDVLEPGPGSPFSAAPGAPIPLATVFEDMTLGLPDGVTIDALSFGNDSPIDSPMAGDKIVLFSVDNASIGYPLATTDVYVESAGTDGAAAADIFASAARPALPGAAPCVAKANRLLVDGDGLLAGGAPRTDALALGLDESPSGPPGASGRDDLSFLEMSDNTIVDNPPDGTPDQPIFFSVPASVAPSLNVAADPFGTTRSGADIYLKHPTTGLVRFADAAALGLATSDEIDALALYHPGTGTTFASTDIAVFSLAPASPSLTTLAAPCQGGPGNATASDLWVKQGTSALAGYLSAEQMGLCAKRTYGLCNPYVATGDDNVDAIDIIPAGVTDTDSDGVSDATDNCPTVYNPGQQNSDRYIGNGKGIAGDDGTSPNSDTAGDACDPDDDNDGIADGTDSVPRGDITYDDDNDGEPGIGCLGGTDAADDGPSWDGDCDAVRDGVACIGSATVDADGDRLMERWEICKWGTSDTDQDTDDDGMGDCDEVMDVNGDGLVAFLGDLTNGWAKAIQLPAADFGKDGDFDLDGSDSLAFLGDLMPAAQRIQQAPGSGGCVP